MIARNFAYIHRDGCGGIAFYMEGKPVSGSPLPASSDVELPNGERPAPCSLIVCGSCRRPLLATFPMCLSSSNVFPVRRRAAKLGLGGSP